ncbi:MAG: HIT family protein [Acidimicrobiales bacterium]
MTACVFCQIISNALPAHVVLDEPGVLAFLDARPVFPGHVLVVPRDHHGTLTDLPPDAVGPYFASVQRVAAAVRDGLGTDGTFVAMNNVVSQSVPHLHTHVVPRRFKDGLRGFFWPRQRYADDDDAAAYAAKVASAIEGRQ